MKKIEQRLLSICILLFSMVLVLAGGRGIEIGILISIVGLMVALF